MAWHWKPAIRSSLAFVETEVQVPCSIYMAFQKQNTCILISIDLDSVLTWQTSEQVAYTSVTGKLQTPPAPPTRPVRPCAALTLGKKKELAKGRKADRPSTPPFPFPTPAIHLIRHPLNSTWIRHRITTINSWNCKNKCIREACFRQKIKPRDLVKGMVRRSQKEINRELKQTKTATDTRASPKKGWLCKWVIIFHTFRSGPMQTTTWNHHVLRILGEPGRKGNCFRFRFGNWTLVLQIYFK